MIQIASYLLLLKGFGQLEVLMFIGPRIEDHAGTRTETFDFGDIVHAKSTALVKSPRVRKHMAPPGSVDVEFDPLTAKRTLGVKGVRSPPTQQLNEFHKPYR